MKILWRLAKVIYIFLFLMGFLGAYLTWLIAKPYVVETYLYQVVCDNGNKFDPLSKPIERDYIEPYSFRTDQLKSECEYGDAFLIGNIDSLGKNFELLTKTYKNTTGSVAEQLKAALFFLFFYNVILELIRRISLYILFGKRFISL